MMERWNGVRGAFPAKISRARRVAAGRTAGFETPVAIRTSGMKVSPRFEDYVRERLGRRLGRYGPSIERITVRFEDVNGPRGGVGVACKIKVVVSGSPSVIVETRARTAKVAFDSATDPVTRSVKRTLDRSWEPRRRAAPRPRRAEPAMPEETPKRRTNVRGRLRGATAAFEETEGRPSRKSSRKSANRARSGNKLARKASRTTSSSKRKATRAAASRTGRK